MTRMTREGHCEHPECEEKIKAKRLCQHHYYKMLYPKHYDRPNVVLKKKKINVISGEDLWALIEADLKSGKISLSEYKS
jgi:hypothetical protein